MLSHLLVICPARWPFILCDVAQRYCAVLPQSGFLSGQSSAAILRSGVRVLLIIRAAFVSPPRFLRAPACCPFPTSMPTLPGQQAGARILRISPRLPPCQPTHHLSRSKCGDLPPHSPRSFSPFSFLHICMILATQHALRVPVSNRISSHLYVLSNVSVVPISCAEQSLDFPFSSAFLIGCTGCLYGPSPKEVSLLATGK